MRSMDDRDPILTGDAETQRGRLRPACAPRHTPRMRDIILQVPLKSEGVEDMPPAPSERRQAPWDQAAARASGRGHLRIPGITTNPIVSDSPHKPATDTESNLTTAGQTVVAPWDRHQLGSSQSDSSLGLILRAPGLFAVPGTITNNFVIGSGLEVGTCTAVDSATRSAFDSDVGVTVGGASLSAGMSLADRALISAGTSGAAGMAGSPYRSLADAVASEPRLRGRARGLFATTPMKSDKAAEGIAPSLDGSIVSLAVQGEACAPLFPPWAAEGQTLNRTPPQASGYPQTPVVNVDPQRVAEKSFEPEAGVLSVAGAVQAEDATALGVASDLADMSSSFAGASTYVRDAVHSASRLDVDASALSSNMVSSRTPEHCHVCPTHDNVRSFTSAPRPEQCSSNRFAGSPSFKLNRARAALQAAVGTTRGDECTDSLAATWRI